ncbi:hypothetical protein COY27_06490 [Candidatus Woesearchaeota archaeon CG_4_10_14_0_2_um_filter_33_13]|nr:MAG: hypothetical protein COY27_06490 [Candidatus Woesearchaeota archaeon CG_4_10_14_0_2_um_filter_33_13]
MYHTIAKVLATGALGVSLLTPGCQKYEGDYCSLGGDGAISRGTAVGYRVQVGDTLEDIARDRGTSVDRLLILNEIDNGDFIEPDMRLCIPRNKGNHKK